MEENNNPPQPPQQQQQQQPPPVDLLQIQDIDEWLRFNGLRAAGDEPPQAPEYNSFMSSTNQSEAQANYDANDRYQEQVHATIFKADLKADEQQQVCRQRMLGLWQNEEMEIVTPQQTFAVSLTQLAAECDTIFTLASSRRYMHNLTASKKKGDGDDSNNNNDATPKDDPDHEQQNSSQVTDKVTISLEEYSTEAVHEFLSLVLAQKALHEINDQYVVDCCHIAHYLQCARIVEGTAQILLQHIDSDNCLSLCQMADQLELPYLFERALFHMLKSLENLEAQEAYVDFSSELKGRIADIRTVFSNHKGDNNSKDGSDNSGDDAAITVATGNLPTVNQQHQRKRKRQLYFTSLNEYIAIFAETVQYHRERLEEAKEQNTKTQYSSYAQTKIEKQEVRVLALEAMLQEQKRMFGRKQENSSLLRAKWVNASIHVQVLTTRDCMNQFRAFETINKLKLLWSQ